MKHLKFQTVKAAVALLLATFLLPIPDAGAAGLTFKKPNNKKPRVGEAAVYRKIGKQDGKDVDMHATLVSQTGPVKVEFSTIGDDFNVMLKKNKRSGSKEVVIRYQFFESGTTNPLPITTMDWIVLDIDKARGRTEYYTVEGGSAMAVNTPSKVIAEDNGGVFTFTGTADMDERARVQNPEGMGLTRFVNKETITVTYGTYGGGTAYFVHDGDGDFSINTPVPTADGVYLTYHITNDEEVPVKMNFKNRLPGPVRWDTEFEPVLAEGATTDELIAKIREKRGSVANGAAPGGGVAGNPDARPGELFRDILEFKTNDREVSFKEILVPPGTTQFTLKTAPLNDEGSYENVAITVPSADSGFPQVEMESRSIIDLSQNDVVNDEPDVDAAVPVPLIPPDISITSGGGGSDYTVTLTDLNPPGVASLQFKILSVPAWEACEIIKGNDPSPSGFVTYSSTLNVDRVSSSRGFVVVAYAKAIDPGYTDSGYATDYDLANVDGLRGGHYDVDTTDGGVTPGGGGKGKGKGKGSDDDDGGGGGATYDTDVWPEWPGGGKTDKHSHQYDDKVKSPIIDMMNMQEGQASVTDNVDINQRFKIIVINADLSPKAHIAINEDVTGRSPYVTSYDDTAFSALPVYTLSGTGGTTKLEKLQLGFDNDAITGAGLIPSNTGAVKSNTPGKNGEWRNGALTVQIVKVNNNGSAILPLDGTKSNGGHGVAPSPTMDHEMTVFWHWPGDDYDDAANGYIPGESTTVGRYIEEDAEPECDGARAGSTPWTWSAGSGWTGGSSGGGSSDDDDGD